LVLMKAKQIIEHIQEIYSKFPVPINLKRHMLMVGGVAEILCDNSKVKINKEEIIAAALIHDLGNVIKMHFEKDYTWRHLLDKKDLGKLDYYKEKQEEFRKKYGESAELANQKIAKELKAPKKVVGLLKPRVIKVKNGKGIVAKSFEKQLLLYSDLRVAPKGVVPLRTRLEEYAKRYAFSEDPEKTAHSNIYINTATKMEKNIFRKIKIKPEEITQKTVNNIIAANSWN